MTLPIRLEIARGRLLDVLDARESSDGAPSPAPGTPAILTFGHFSLKSSE